MVTYKRLPPSIIPNMDEIGNKSLPELQNLKFKKAVWIGDIYLNFELTDGQNCFAGEKYPGVQEETYYFDPSKKITSIEMVIYRNEVSIKQIIRSQLQMWHRNTSHS
jgi:hypothetical protein